jgi:iron complex transport system ATP-binding protein
MALIRVEALSLARRLQSIDLELQPGELLGVIGPNGAGKSSLLESLAGIQPCSGRISFEGHDLNGLELLARARQIAFLPQRPQVAWQLRVRDVIALGRLPWGDESPRIIARAARSTGVEAWLDVPVDRLSGGEQARVWLARLLAGEPRLILADEPLASLDLYHQQQVLGLLRSHTGAGRGVILSLHDLALAAAWCDRLLLLQAGRVVALGTPHAVLTAENLRRVFRVAAEIDFSAAVPLLRMRRREPL